VKKCLRIILLYVTEEVVLIPLPPLRNILNINVSTEKGNLI
jgi:hypothetical protein